MRRFIFFFGISVILIGITFGLSLLLFPDWIKQIEWQKYLLVRIIIGGLILIAEFVVAWLLSFLFEDSELKERALFVAGNKYKEISNRLDEFTKSQLNKEKHSRKYIPNIFIESTHVKEKLRYFSDPYLFFPKIVQQTDRRLRNSSIVSTLKQIHYPVDLQDAPSLKKTIRNSKTLTENVNTISRWLDHNSQITSMLSKGEEIGLKPEFKTRIPQEFSHIYEYVLPNLQYSSLFDWIIEEAKEDLALLTNKVIIIKSKAGHGKTNLLCDFTENFLRKKNCKCIYLSAREFNYMGNQETIEQVISKIIFTGEKYQFSDILRLIKFDKKIKYLFVLIDGINEHKDLSLFSTALGQFISRCNTFDIKIILTCRSEYFNERFGELLTLEHLSVIDIDGWKLTHEIPDVHQKELMSRYFSEFNIKMNPKNVLPEIIDKFYKDKLLLRIFCEAYENEQTADNLYDLYKLEIFHKYLEKKSAVIPGLMACLSEIISFMTAHDEFRDIQITNLSRDTVEVIEATAYENVIIRKDITRTPDIAFGSMEVINFVYDEFRDFLLASKIIENWANNHPSSREEITRLTEVRSSISEGLQRYLCLWGIKNDERELLDFLALFEWFNSVFVKAVFGSPDALITDFLMVKIQDLFSSDVDCALRIIFNLFYRLNVDDYPNLNIDHLFKFFNELDEPDYQNIVLIAMNSDYDLYTSFIAFFSHVIIEECSDQNLSSEGVDRLIKFLGYLINVKEKKDYRFREYEFGLYPARDVLTTVSSLLGKERVITPLKEVIESTNIDSIKNALQEIMDQM